MKAKHVEPTRVREHGTEVTRTTSGKERVDACRRIVEEGQYAKVDGVMVDGFSASAIVTVYDALSEKGKAKMEKMDIVRMADISFRVLAKQRKGG